MIFNAMVLLAILKHMKGSQRVCCGSIVWCLCVKVNAHLVEYLRILYTH